VPGKYIITSTCDLTVEIQHRVNLASASFERLSKRVLTNRDLSTRTKIAVYNAIYVSTLLYTCEGWTPYRRRIRALEAFHILQTILHVHWWEKISRFAAEQAQHAPRRYSSEDNWGGLAM